MRSAFAWLQARRVIVAPRPYGEGEVPVHVVGAAQSRSPGDRLTHRSVIPPRPGGTRSRGRGSILGNPASENSGVRGTVSTGQTHPGHATAGRFVVASGYLPGVESGVVWIVLQSS
jgi:hypothetical protein